MKLRAKLFGSSLVILVLVLGFSATGLFVLQLSAQRTHELYSVYQQALGDIQTIGLDLYKANRRATELAFSYSDQRMTANFQAVKYELGDSVAGVKTAFESLQDHLPVASRSASTQDLIDQFELDSTRWSEIMNVLVENIDNRTGFHDAFFSSALTAALDNMTAGVDSLSAEMQASSQMAFDDIQAQNQWSLILFLSFAAVVLVLVLVVLVFQDRVIVKPILRVHQLLADIARGEADLTRTLPPASRDEIGQICRDFNSFLGALRSLVSAIQQNMQGTGAVAESLHQDSAEVSAALVQIHANNEGIRQNIQVLDGRLAEASQSTQTLFRALEGLRERVEEEKSLVGTSVQTIQGVVDGIQAVTVLSQAKKQVSSQLVENSRESGQQLDEAAASVERINNAVGTILEMTQAVAAIAEQTNLLSMNAAIEAAHAGSAGAGFSVVADEIRKLASHSTTQSSDIGRELKSIVAEIQRAWDHTLQARTAFAALLGEVEDVTRALEDIGERNVRLQSMGNQVREALDGLGRASAAVSLDMDSIGQSTQGVEAAMDLVRRVSSEVSTGMGEISEGTKEISLSTQKGTESNRLLAEQVQAVRSDLARFKV